MSLMNPKDTLLRLKERAKNYVSKTGKIVYIPKDQLKIACTNSAFHGKMHVSIVFRPGLVQGGKVVRREIDEVVCECGIIYIRKN